MGMELRVTMELSDGDRYPNETSVTRKFEVNLPWAPGNHNAETALVEAISSIVNFGEVIGELHEELTAKYDEKLAKAGELPKSTESVEPVETLPVTGGGLGNANGDGGAYGGNADDTEVPQ